MSTTIRRSLSRFRVFGNLFATRQTDPRQLQELIQCLHPLQTEHDLIRVGPDGDGGYLVPDDLSGITSCFSPGVNDVSGFEADCANRGMNVFMADASVNGPAEEHERFDFSKMFLGAVPGTEFMTIDDWVRDFASADESELLLQMDIENAEYEVLLSMSQSLLSRFRILVIEFHQLDQLWSAPFFGIAKRAFEKLLSTHSCVHIHPNNCGKPIQMRGLSIPPIMEFTFLRNDRITRREFVGNFPHQLDADNLDKKPLTLPECWMRAA